MVPLIVHGHFPQYIGSARVGCGPVLLPGRASTRRRWGDSQRPALGAREWCYRSVNVTSAIRFSRQNCAWFCDRLFFYVNRKQTMRIPKPMRFLGVIATLALAILISPYFFWKALRTPSEPWNPRDR